MKRNGSDCLAQSIDECKLMVSWLLCVQRSIPCRRGGFAPALALMLWAGCTASGFAGALTAITSATAAIKAEGQSSFAAPVRADLPHHWDRLFPGKSGSVIYMIELPPPDDATDSYAIYAQRIGNRFEVFASGVSIAKYGEPGERADFARQPVIVAIPREAMHGARLLELRVTMDPVSQGGLAPLVFGSERQIRDLNRSEAWGRTYVPMMTLAALTVLISFSLVLWLRTRESLYGFFTGLASAWVLRIAIIFITHPPLPPVWWAALLSTAYPIYAGFLFLFTARLFEFEWRWHRNVITALTVLAVLTVAGGFLAGQPAVYRTVMGAMTLAGIYFLVRALLATIRHPVWERILFCLVATLNVVCAVRDWLMISFNPSGLGVVDWSRQSVMLFNLVMAWIIADRFIKSLRAYRQLSDELAGRVALRERELSAIYETQRAAERDAAVQAERQRIMRDMRDMHDGLGAQLVGMLNGLKTDSIAPQELEQHVQESLDQLRLTIDALEPVEGDLATVLGHLRFRLGKRLDAAGIRLDWQVEALPALSYLTPSVVSHIQKIAVEAFTNIAKHAKADRVRVAAYADATQIHIEIEDNGIGLNPSDGLPGRGLKNMQFRADAIGATLSISPGAAAGTLMAVRLPLLQPAR